MVRYTIEAIVKLKLESQKKKITLAKGSNHDRHSFSNEYIREESLLFFVYFRVEELHGTPESIARKKQSRSKQKYTYYWRSFLLMKG